MVLARTVGMLPAEMYIFQLSARKIFSDQRLDMFKHFMRHSRRLIAG